ncbi:MAG: GNAT family N-acetyltransferase [Trueperaceae bacterium]|nr:GNAT family N-acetyltransferase [Trueperaceae bacterium]
MVAERTGGAAHEVHIHPLVTMDGLRGCELLQQQVWAYADREIVPAAQMRAALHAGALVAGAFLGREHVGFLYGFPALPHEEGLMGVGMHSHMLAVRPEARGMGIGRALKWYQRRWCRERGIRWVSWTFDPLQARNAHLNLERLGAIVHEYQVDFYGVLGGHLSGTLPTDRFVAMWWLEHDRVERRARSDPAAAIAGGSDVLEIGERAERPRATDPGDRAWILEAGPDDDPGAQHDERQESEVWLAAPRDVSRLRAHVPEIALSWREAYKRLVPAYLARGYEVRGFVDGAYVLCIRRLQPPRR